MLLMQVISCNCCWLCVYLDVCNFIKVAVIIAVIAVASNDDDDDAAVVAAYFKV